MQNVTALKKLRDLDISPLNCLVVAKAGFMLRYTSKDMKTSTLQCKKVLNSQNQHRVLLRSGQLRTNSGDLIADFTTVGQT